MPDESVGPFLSAAFFCERILDEKDGTLSAIRIVDQLALFQSEIPTTDSPPFIAPTNILVKFVSYGVEGKRDLKLVINSPTGNETELINFPLVFQPKAIGCNFLMKLNLGIKDEGLYWLVGSLDGQPVIRVPLMVVFQKVEVASSVQGP